MDSKWFLLAKFFVELENLLFGRSQLTEGPKTVALGDEQLFLQSLVLFSQAKKVENELDGMLIELGLKMSWRFKLTLWS